MNKNFGYVIVLVSTACYALLTPLLKKSSEKVPPFTLIAISMFILAISAFIVSIFIENSLHLKYSALKIYIYPLIVVGIINLLGFWLAVEGYKYMPVWQQTLFSLFSPLLSGVFAYFILGEQLNPKLIIALLIMGLGLFIGIR